MFSLGLQFGFGVMAAVVIVKLIDDIWEWFIQRRKAKKGVIGRRYYFVSYIGINNTDAWVVGHCTVEFTNGSLPMLANGIQKENGFKNPATIIFLKNLTKEEYDTLHGN